MPTLLSIVLLSLVALPGSSALAQARDPFPTPAAMRHQVDFWQRVYVEIDTDQGFIHDDRRLDVVYETVRLGSSARSRASERLIGARKRHWRAAVERLAAGQRDASTRRALAAWKAALGRPPRTGELRAAVKRVRFQRGQRRKFVAGLVRAGAWEPRMRRILEAYGVPSDLAYLPHVESSFDGRAYSKSGAAGMWQFMPATGRQYMTIDQAVDERLSPLAATRAAARLLRDNHASLNSWPLAITAYNHGAGGMRRAKKKLATADIATIVARYRGRTFGFASRNFYAQFLAARRVARNPGRHFGHVERHRPERVEVVKLDFYADLRDLAQHLAVPRDLLQSLNPALLPAVTRSEKHVPRGFELRLPPGTLPVGAPAWLASVPRAMRHPAQRPSRVHVVRKGETLGRIARRHGTSVTRLVALNGLRSRHRIRIGQQLVLDTGAAPAERRRTTTTLAAAKPRAVAAAMPAPVAAENLAVADEAPAPVPEAAPAAPPAPVPAVMATSTIQVAAAASPAQGPRWRRLDGDWTMVGHDETIGHFADWLGLSNARLRALNGLSSRRHLRMGQRIRLDFSQTPRQTFIARRAAHHDNVAAKFFARYALIGTKVHHLRRGENLWVLSRQVYDVPTWLLYQHNVDSVLRRLSPGTPINIPVLEPIT